MSSVQALAPNERIDLLDIIRGFALLGVLSINIYDFSGFDYALDQTKQGLATYSIDLWVERIVKGIFQGKFYAIFSILFGIGFSIQIERLRQKTTRWKKIFFRRLLILLLFGVVHIQFLWVGDILVLYASLGFLLTIFVHVSDRKLLISAVCLLLLPMIIDSILIPKELKPWDWMEGIALAMDEKNGIPNDDIGWRTYPFEPSHGFREFWHWMQPAPFYRLHGLLIENRIPRVLGLFLLGYFFGRKKYFNNPEANLDLFKKAIFYGLLLGIPANVIYFTTTDALIKSVFYGIGIPTLAVAYMAIISLLQIKGRNFVAIATVGRMALTNYLSQTILCLLIFYSIGFGLGGNIGATAIFLIGLFLYSLQVLFSHLWLKSHSYGPMEAIWRKLTYL